MQGPRHKVGQMLLRQLGAAWPGDTSAQLCALFNMVSRILVSDFGNLNSMDCWKKLYNHICRDTPFAHYDVSSLPICQLVKATIFRLQSMTPIRFSFINGQARMVAVAHYIRRLVPCASDGHQPGFQSMDDVGCINHSNGLWSLDKTGCQADCVLFCTDPPRPDSPDRYLSSEIMFDLNKISSHVTAGSSIAEVTHFSDSIHSLIRKVSSIHPLPLKLSGFPKHVVSLFDVIVQEFSSCEGLSATLLSSVCCSSGIGQVDESTDSIPKPFSPETTFARAIEMLNINNNTPTLKKPFPVLTSHIKVSTSELCVISFLLMALLPDVKGRLILAECMNKKWKVSIPAVDMALFHPGTIVGPIGEEPTLFEAKLFRVSVKQKIRFSMIATRNYSLHPISYC
jgi:hypothetical protein